MPGRIWSTGMISGESGVLASMGASPKNGTTIKNNAKIKRNRSIVWSVYPRKVNLHDTREYAAEAIEPVASPDGPVVLKDPGLPRGLRPDGFRANHGSEPREWRMVPCLCEDCAPHTGENYNDRTNQRRITRADRRTGKEGRGPEKRHAGIPCWGKRRGQRVRVGPLPGHVVLRTVGAPAGCSCRLACVPRRKQIPPQVESPVVRPINRGGAWRRFSRLCLRRDRRGPSSRKSRDRTCPRPHRRLPGW